MKFQFQFQVVSTVIYLTAMSTLGFSLLIEELNAQTQVPIQERLDIPIDDQARYLGGLESRSASQWGFVSDNRAEIAESYQLQVSDSEVKITEQKPPEWRNTGDDPNYSVLVDIYEFTEETNSPEFP